MNINILFNRKTQKNINLKIYQEKMLTVYLELIEGLT